VDHPTPAGWEMVSSIHHQLLLSGEAFVDFSWPSKQFVTFNTSQFSAWLSSDFSIRMGLTYAIFGVQHMLSSCFYVVFFCLVMGLIYESDSYMIVMKEGIQICQLLQLLVVRYMIV